MKTILFVPIHQPSWQELYLLARYMQQNNLAKPVLLVINTTIAQCAEKSDCEDIELVYINKLKSSSVHMKEGFLSTLKSFVRHNTVLRKVSQHFLEQYESTSAQIKKEIKTNNFKINKYYEELITVFNKYSFHSVVITGDRHFSDGFEPAVLKICLHKGIPTVIPPISYTANKESLLQLRINRLLFEADRFPWIAQSYPKQVVFDSKSQRNIQFFTPAQTESLAQNNILPENPWVMGGGYSTKVLADGDETRQRYIKLGCKPEKIVITGHRTHDQLYQLLQKKEDLKKLLLATYSYSSNRPLIIVALPQLAEHNLLDWPDHWREIRFLCQTLSEVKADVLISLHPKMDRNNYSFIEKDYGFSLAIESLSDILPAADIFISTFSSTVQWAVLCKIPTIVVDFYGMNYNMYDFLTGIKVLKEKKSLHPTLEKLLDDENYCKNIIHQLSNDASFISPFDGKCAERIVNEIINVK